MGTLVARPAGVKRKVFNDAACDIEAAMVALSRAAGRLFGKTPPPPPEYYECNRAWLALANLRRKLTERAPRTAKGRR